MTIGRDDAALFNRAARLVVFARAWPPWTLCRAPTLVESAVALEDALMRGIWLALTVVALAVALEWSGCTSPRLTLPRADWHIADPNPLSCCH